MGIFDDAFQTQGPDTSAALALMEQALSARKQALDPTNILQSFEKGAKVFTDMEDRQRKANTANLKRKLASIPPALMEDLLRNGVDPIEFVQNSWSPIDVADEGLNTTWGNQIQAAKKDATARAIYNELNRTPEQVEQDMLNGVTVADRASPYADLADKELYSLESNQNQNIRDRQTMEVQRMLYSLTPQQQTELLTNKGILKGREYADLANAGINSTFGGFNKTVTDYNTAMAMLDIDNISAEEIREGWLNGKDPILERLQQLQQEGRIDPTNTALQNAITARKQWVQENLGEDGKRQIAAMSDDELKAFYKGTLKLENQDRMKSSTLNDQAKTERSLYHKAQANKATIKGQGASSKTLVDEDKTADEYATEGLDRGALSEFTSDSLGAREADSRARDRMNYQEQTRDNQATSEELYKRAGETPDSKHFDDFTGKANREDEATSNVAKDMAEQIPLDRLITKPINKIMELVKESHNPEVKKQLTEEVKLAIAKMDKDGLTQGRTKAELADIVYKKMGVPEGSIAREGDAYWNSVDNTVFNEVKNREVQTTENFRTTQDAIKRYKELSPTNPEKAERVKKDYIKGIVDNVLGNYLTDKQYDALTGDELSETTIKTARLAGLAELQKDYKNDLFNEEYLWRKEAFEIGLAQYASKSASATETLLKQIDEEKSNALNDIRRSNSIKIKNPSDGAIKGDTPQYVKDAFIAVIPEGNVGDSIRMLLQTDDETQNILLSEIIRRMDLDREVKEWSKHKEGSEGINKDTLLSKDQKAKFVRVFQQNLVKDLTKLKTAYQPESEAIKKLRDKYRSNLENGLNARAK